MYANSPHNHFLLDKEFHMSKWVSSDMVSVESTTHTLEVTLVIKIFLSYVKLAFPSRFTVLQKLMILPIEVSFRKILQCFILVGDL